jgi:3-deoxy-D-manno-octulosonic-acid transferase
MERRGEVEAMLQREAAAGGGLAWHFRSRGAAPAEVDIAVGDTTGELGKFTQLADLVFVGKSLAPHTEGQSPIEAAAAGRAILFGGGMSNFREISRRLVEAGAAREVRDVAELCAEAARVLGDPAAREKMMAASAACYRVNQGAVARTLAAIGEFLD